ncbi:MAG: SIS domain-containing protein [Caulobacteraceae bacterium]
MTRAADAAAPAPGALMFAEAASAHEAVRAQLSEPSFAALGARLRALAPRAIATCARGSSDHAATFAKYLIETHAGVLTPSLAPSVLSLYRAQTTLKDVVLLIISQSGASPDLVAAAEAAKRAGAFVLALVNAPDSPVARAADEILPLCAGAERSVAATKSFVASLSAITALVAHWTGDLGLQRALEGTPDLLREAWALDWSAATPALTGAQSMYVVARGLGFGIAGEAALKLKETCRIHAEAYSAAEVRHGPMALVRRDFPALLFAQSDQTRNGVIDLANDLNRRGASVFLAGAQAEGATALPALEAHPAIQPILLVQAFYRFAHGVALARGCDPDRPPHLTKITETL